MVSIWADWGAAEGTGALGQPELGTRAPCASSPHLPALLRTGTSIHSARLSPKDVPPTHTANTHLAWPRRTSTSLAEHPGENSGPVWKQKQIASVLGERPSVKVCVHGVFRRRVPLLTLASAPAMQRQNSSWDFLVGSRILLQANTQLKHHPEIFAGKLLL